MFDLCSKEVNFGTNYPHRNIMSKTWLERTKQLWLEKRLPYRIKHKLGNLGVLPNCLIVGAQKAGTTSLYEHLIRHPNVWPPDARELNFFNDYWTQGETWYRARFPNQLIQFWSINLAQQPFVTLESTPEYFLDNNVPIRVAKLIPDCKLIFLLRNPIDRAYSHWKMNVRRKFETLSFEEAIEKELERIELDLKHAQEESFALKNNSALALYSYLYRGKYLERLQPWLDIFSGQQIKIINSEELWKDINNYYDVLDFLSLSKDKQATDKFNKFYGSNTASKDMQETTRKFLRDYFQEPNQRLFEFLNKNWDWN